MSEEEEIGYWKLVAVTKNAEGKWEAQKVWVKEKRE